MSALFTEPEDKIDETKDYFVELVGEDKRFKSPTELAKAKVEADLFIEQLKRETQQLRDELKGKATLEDFIDKMKTPITPSADPDPAVPAAAPDSGSIQDEVKRILEAERAQERASRNLQEVQTALEQTYGSDYPKALKAKARELGMSEQEATALAERSPKAFLSLFANGQAPAGKPSVFTPVQGAVQTQFKPSVQFKGQKYYDDLRRSNPNEYFSVKVQKEMFETVRDVGLEEFRKY